MRQNKEETKNPIRKWCALFKSCIFIRSSSDLRVPQKILRIFGVTEALCLFFGKNEKSMSGAPFSNESSPASFEKSYQIVSVRPIISFSIDSQRFSKLTTTPHPFNGFPCAGYIPLQEKCCHCD